MHEININKNYFSSIFHCFGPLKRDPTLFVFLCILGPRGQAQVRELLHRYQPDHANVPGRSALCQEQFRFIALLQKIVQRGNLRFLCHELRRTAHTGLH